MLDTYIPSNIKQYNKNQLNVLCDELRSTIYETVMSCGGHLSSNLGAVEPTVALFYVFDFPKDKIIFDVGHQCYAYKLLSGRKDRFTTLRKEGGLSGFPKRLESEYDSYDTGHAGTSVSAALGIAKARDLKKQDFNVIAFIGDGSFNNGLVYEALNSIKILNTKILIVLNDNGMSISPTVGGMHDILEQIKINKTEENIKLLERFGLTYMGINNGNDAEEMVDAFSKAKELLKEQSVLLHIVTKKGKGYEFCEEHPVNTHGVSPVGTVKQKEYSEVLGNTLCSLAKEDSRIVAVTAAMTGSLGLDNFFNLYPDRAFDVGICEENASVLCSSMATMGLKPYYAIYSTFLQRSFDELIHDVCGQDLPVTLCIDRAGISGADGETHQGVFDISYLSLIPGITIASPKDVEEFKKMVEFSATFNHPLAIRYPRSGKMIFSFDDSKIEVGKWEYLKYVKDNFSNITIIATGERCIIIAMKIWEYFFNKNININIVNGRFIKPLDEELLSSLDSGNIITIEDNVLIGGFGQMINNFIINKERENNKVFKVKNFAYRDEFIHQGNIQDLQNEFGVGFDEIKDYIMEIIK